MIDAHTLEVLEFSRVLELAVRHAASPGGVTWLRALVPTTERDEADHRLAMTDEMRRLTGSAAGFPAPEAPDVGGTLDSLEAVGVVLDPPELKALAALAGLARRIRERLRDCAGDFPLVAACAAELVPAPHFERAVEDTFGPHDEVLDSASPLLKQTRRQIRQQREKILGRLEHFTGGAHGSERTVTVRGDRYLLAVRSSERGEIGGIVHDRSATGATSYVEPVGLIEENNRLTELLSGERDEIRRILAALSDVARGLRQELRVDHRILSLVDGHRALALLAGRQGAIRPVLSESVTEFRLVGLRHPLLSAGPAERTGGGGGPRDVVPLDLQLTAENRVLLVTGPNMGGKTVALKATGLACVMAACGFHLPARPGTEVPILSTLVADIGDEQSIELDLSTFASHLRRWIEATAAAGPGSLALLDEIGAGTDPAEGAALAQAVLERLAQAGGLALTTTHLGALKRFGSGCPGVMNGSMRFDPVTERPLYQLEPGVPGQSRAIEMARRLGMPGVLIDRAAGLVGSEEQGVQALLSDLEAARSRVAETLSRAEAERRAAVESRERYEGRSRRLADDYEALKRRAVREGERLLDRAQAILRDAEEAADEAKRHAAAAELGEARRRVREQVRQVATVREEVRRQTEGDAVPGRAVSAVEVKAGERFWAHPLQAWVTIVEPPGRTDKVRVERNGVRVELPVAALRAPGGPPVEPARRRAIDELPPDEAPRRRGTVTADADGTTRGEVDLRGLTAEEALERVEAYLDSAMLGGLTEVRIIHGKGTGVLRQAVRQWLSTCPAVKSHRLGETWEGGTGVTVARLE